MKVESVETNRAIGEPNTGNGSSVGVKRLMECLLGFIRCLLCCYDDDQEENRGRHRYHTIPDFVQRPNYETQRNSSVYIAPTPILSKPVFLYKGSRSPQRETSSSKSTCSPQSSNSNQKSLRKPQTNFHSPSTSSVSTAATTISKAKCSSANTPVSNSNHTNSKKTVLSPLPSPSPNLQKSLVQNCVESPQSSVKSLVASSSNLKPPAKTAIPSFDYGKAIGIAPQSVKKTQVGVASLKSVAPLVQPAIQGNICRTQKPIPSSEPWPLNKSISEPVKRETPEVRPSAKTSIPSCVNASLDDTQSSIKNVASASKKKKNKASLTESPQSLKTSVHNPQVGVASPKSEGLAFPISPVIQGNLCHSQKPIPSISKPMSRETQKNEQDPFQYPSPSTSLPLSFKPPPLIPMETCSSSTSLDIPKKGNYAWPPTVTTPLYSVPEDFKELIKRNIVPPVLRRCPTPATYKNFFEALMYAEDYYCEKWSDYLLEDKELELQKAALHMKSRRATNRTGNQKNKNMNENGKKEKVFVAFRIYSVPEKRPSLQSKDYVNLGQSGKGKEDDPVQERRPFLLSRDYVNLRYSGEGKEVEPYQGVIYRVVQGNLVLAEFGDDFYLQHSPSRKYDVSFSFNRVCLKRSYQALSATTDTLLHNFLFPSQIPRLNMLDPPYFTPYLHNLNKNQSSAVYNILRLNSSPPFLVEGPLCAERSTTYFVIQEAVKQIYRSSPGSRILINAPGNIICDWLMTSLMVEIPESEIFRANAAFREKKEVNEDILPLCPFEGECFTCPSLKELQEFRVVLTTYMSSFRLHKEGISSSHFSHIFLLDASSIMEPEMIVSLSNLADEKTVVVVTGKYGNCSTWVRSSIGRGYGLNMSYFERLMEREPYCSLDPLFVARIRD